MSNICPSCGRKIVFTQKFAFAAYVEFGIANGEALTKLHQAIQLMDSMASSDTGLRKAVRLLRRVSTSLTIVD